ncbi:MAG: hypothetical protein D9V47_11475 [Clostridia bacterium]|nr:MAG: hypothetical protein D9V47_11475 [Clostridia bacterium]
MAEAARYVFYWGCQIPARLAFWEKSIRGVMARVGIEGVEVDGFSCCPEKNLVANWGHRAWLLAAARNLALAERQGLDMLLFCNGCYSTLKSAQAELAASTATLAEVNASLEEIGLVYRGRVRVKHVLEVLHDDIGPGRIRMLLEKPMNGLKIAVHPGCHLLRPSWAIHFDDPLKPTKYDALVEALGAQSLSYQTKMMCCGGALGNVGEGEASLALARKKLLEVQEAGADAITVSCPSCFMQFDQKQYLAQRQGEQLHVPVFSYVELLGLAMGLEPEELGLSGHRVDLAPFFASWDKHRRDFDQVRRHLDLAAVRNCYACGACVSDCPVAEITPEFEPNRLIGEVLDGRIEALLSGRQIWMCLECHTCYELCPQKFGMEKVFTTLKHLSLERQKAPASMQGAVKSFLTSGRLGAPDVKARQKLGLPPSPAPPGDDFKQLLGRKE